MNEYEILLLLDPELSDEAQAEIVTRVRDLVEKGGGTFERHDPWGKRKLSYEIGKQSDGNYHLLHFSANPETLDEVSRVLKIDDRVMRHMATRRPETGPGQPIAVGGPTSEDADDEVALAFEEE